MAGNKASQPRSQEKAGEAPLAFPMAAVVRRMRKNLAPGKQIKGRVKLEMNRWLGAMVDRVTRRMNAHPYAYVDYAMFRDAIEVYEKLEDVKKEKERIHKYLEKIKDDCELLQREVAVRFDLEDEMAGQSEKRG